MTDGFNFIDNMPGPDEFDDDSFLDELDAEPPGELVDNADATVADDTPPLSQAADTEDIATPDTDCRALIEQPERESRLKYKALAEAPPLHRNVCRMVVLGATAEDISALYGVSALWVREIVNHPPIAAHIREMEVKRKIRQLGRNARLGKLIDTGLRQLGAALENPKVGALTKLKIIEFAADRQQDQSMIKRTKVDKTITSRIVDSKTLLEMSRQAAALGRGNAGSFPVAIDAKFKICNAPPSSNEGPEAQQKVDEPNEQSEDKEEEREDGE